MNQPVFSILRLLHVQIIAPELVVVYHSDYHESTGVNAIASIAFNVDFTSLKRRNK